ncbi:hypothetical protein ACGFLT_07915 [Micromonospora chalcea]
MDDRELERDRVRQERIDAIERFNRSSQMLLVGVLVLLLALLCSVPSIEQRDAVVGAASIVTSVSCVIYLRIHMRRVIHRLRFEHLEDRIALMRGTMRYVAKFAEEVESSMRIRMEVLEDLQGQISRNEALSNLTREQAEAINLALGNHFKRQDDSSARLAWFMLIPAFVLGLVVNWLSDPAWDVIKEIWG